MQKPFNWLVLVGLALLVTVLRLPSLEQPFDNDSGANAYHARLIVQGEPLYSTHHPAHHLPAVYYVYALAFLLFGDSLWAVKIFLLLWTIITAYLLYGLGIVLQNKTTGAWAAAFYAVLSSHVHLAGATAEIELFANLPRIAAVLLLLYLVSRKASPWKFMFVGMLGACAFLFKAIYISPLVLAGSVILAGLWQKRSEAKACREALARALWIGVGLMVVLLPVIAYFGLLGLLPRLWLVFTIGKRYVGFRNVGVGFEYLFIYPFSSLAGNNLVLTILSLAGFAIAIRDGFPRNRNRSSIPFWVAVWYVLAYFEAGFSRVNFPHYHLLVIPPLALLAAHFLVKLYSALRSQVKTASRFLATFTVVLMLVGVLFLSVVLNARFHYRYWRYVLGFDTHQSFVINGARGGAGLMRVQELADYVRERTLPSDLVYYWSGYTQIYYLADRRCAIDIIWPIYADATGPYQRIFSPRTKYVILGESNNIPRADWLYTELKGKYVLETVIDEQEVYRRID